MAAAQVILEVACPDSVYQALRAEGYDQSSLTDVARKALAMRLYGEHRLSIGKAAELAGVPVAAFMELLRAACMAVAEYGADEHAEDLRTLDSLGGGGHATP